jgi:hypothetical protein
VQAEAGPHGGGERRAGDKDALEHGSMMANTGDRLLVIGLFVAGLLVSGFTMRRGIEPFDEGLTLQAARRVADGQVPYRDFLWPYGPAHPYLLAGFFKAFGTSLLWWRIVRVVVDAAVALVVFLLLRRVVPRNLALAGWATAALAMAQPTGANPFAPALLFALLATLAASRDRFAAAGLLAALAGAWRIDFGVYALIGAAVAAAAAQSTGPAQVQARRAFARVGAAFAGLTALIYLPFVIADGPADAWRHLVGDSLSQGRYWRLPFPLDYKGDLRPWPPGDLAHDAKDLLQFYVPLLLLIGLALAIAAIALRRRPRPEVAGLAALGVCLVAYLLSRTDEFHATPLIIVVAALATIHVKDALQGQSQSRGLSIGLAAVLALLFAYGASNRLSALLGPPELSAVDVAVADGVQAPPAEARAIERMVRAVQRRVPPGEPIYVVTRRSDLVRINDPLIYVLAERDNPARQDFGLQTGAEAQRDIVAVLERSKPKVIVRWTDPASTLREPNERGRPTGIRTLDRWLAAHYRPAERYGHYEILVPA